MLATENRRSGALKLLLQAGGDVKAKRRVRTHFDTLNTVDTLDIVDILRMRSHCLGAVHSEPFRSPKALLCTWLPRMAMLPV